MISIAGLALATLGGTHLAWAETAQPPKSSDSHLIPLAKRQRLFFAYEKRMRERTELEKIFTYFSTHSTSDMRRDIASTHMLPSDLLRALVATYPASRSSDERGGWMPGERKAVQTLTTHANAHSRRSKVLEQFDVNGDGLIGFDEFVLLLTLLSISSSNIETVFTVVDKDASGEVDAGEFAAVLRLLQDRYQFHPRSLSHSHHPQSTEAGQGKPSGLLISFFGKDQKGLLSVKDFKTFLNDLHEEVVRLEFEHYLPDAKNTIPGIDFARSLVAPCRSAHVETLLDRIELLDKNLLEASVSFAEFESIHRLQAQVDKQGAALDFLRLLGRPATRDELQRVTKRVAGVDLSPLVLDLIMAVFKDESGHKHSPSASPGEVYLDGAMFIEALGRKARYNLFKQEGSSLSSSSSSAAATSSWWSSWVGK